MYMRLHDLLADLAINLADKHGWTLARAMREVPQLTERARTAYRAAGARMVTMRTALRAGY